MRAWSTSVSATARLQFCIQAPFTAEQMRLLITYIVIDNGPYAAVRAAMKRYRKK